MNRQPLLLAWLALAALATHAATHSFQDKTLVVWAAPANLTQRGGSALTFEDNESHFDGVVFGEITPRKWMPGSDTFNRTSKEQQTWAEETVGPGAFVQIAIVYRGRELSVYRSGQPCARYTAPNPPLKFGPQAIVLFGRRHTEAGDPTNSFAGRIKDARIYDQALTAETIAALRPGELSGDFKPWAWWSFADEVTSGITARTGSNRVTTAA